MALSLVSNFVQTTTALTTITSGTVSTAVGDVVVVSFACEDNTAAGSLTIANTGTALTWTNIATTNTANNAKVAAWRGTVATAGNITVTVTLNGGGARSSLCTDVYTGAHATTPVPAGNVFSGVSGTDISQSITPTSTGSMLRMVVGDWAATNTFAAIANVTLEQTFNQPGFYTSAFLKPTTQPLGSGAFTIGETDTSGTIAWIAFEVQAAAAAGTHDTTGALVGSGSQLVGASTSFRSFSVGARPTKRRSFNNSDQLTGFENYNPFVSYSADLSILNYATGGSATHTTTGALVGQGSVITGTSAHILSHQTTGILIGQGSQISGTASRFRSFSASGALIGQGSVIAGTAAHVAVHTTTGILIGQGSVVAGSAARFRAFDTSGTLIGQGSVINGSASRSTGAVTHNTSGALVGQGSLITGSATRFHAINTSGALVGQGSIVNGTATRFRAFTTSGALVGQGSLINGTAAHIAVHTATGALIGQGSQLAGSATRFRAFDTSGALIGSGSQITGAAIRIPPGGITHDTSGALVGQGSAISGISEIIKAITKIGGDDAPHGIYWQDQPRREITRKPIDRLLDKTVKEFFEEVSHDKKLAKKARKIVKPYQKAKEIDWQSLNADLSRVQMLLDLYTEYLLGLDDEEIMILLLAMV